MSTHIKAQRLPTQPGQAGWYALLPEPAQAQRLRRDVTADVAIIGAGFAGLSAARRLHQIDPGLKIAVLDALRVGQGPAGRNSGFMIDLPHDLSTDSYAGDTEHRDQTDTKLNRYAIDFASAFAAENELEAAVFNRCGKINAAASQQGDQLNQAYGHHLSGMGEDYELLDGDDMATLTGSNYYTSGLYTPGSAILQPAAYVRALAQSLEQSTSVRIYELCPVTEMLAQGECWLLKTPNGSVSSSGVILANNGHAESFGFFRRRLMHVFTYASMTKPFPPNHLGGEPQWAMTPSNPMGTTVRKIRGAQGDRIVIRSRFTYNPSMSVSDNALASAGMVHDKKFRQRFPMLEDVAMDYRWAGHLCLSLNGVPAHGEVAEGVFAAVCQNGLGLAKGTIAGISAAELVSGQGGEISRTVCAPAAPKKLPPEPIARLGANSVMRFKEWRAGRE